jgi:hypothetical protein
MSRQLPESIPLGFVHTDDYDGGQEELINFIEVQLCSGCLDNDLELWNYDWTRRIDPRESGPLHRLALDWFGGKSRENGSHPNFPGIKYSCDVTAYPRPIEEEQERWDRDPYEDEWANMRAGSGAYPRVPLYRPELMRGRLLPASDSLRPFERIRGSAPPWSILIRRAALDRAWRAVRNEPAAATDQPSVPVTIDETANTDADPWSADPAADEPAERAPPILNENRRQAALLEYVQRNYGKHVKSAPWKVPNRSELLSLGRRNVAGNINEKDARRALQQLFKDAPRKGGAAYHSKRRTAVKQRG